MHVTKCMSLGSDISAGSGDPVARTMLGSFGPLRELLFGKTPLGDGGWSAALAPEVGRRWGASRPASLPYKPEASGQRQSPLICWTPPC